MEAEIIDDAFVCHHRLLQSIGSIKPDGKSLGIISFTCVKSGDKKQGVDKKEIEFLHGCRIIIQDYSLVYSLYKSNQNMPLIKIKYRLNGHNNKVKLYQTGLLFLLYGSGNY